MAVVIIISRAMPKRLSVNTFRPFGAPAKTREYDGNVTTNGCPVRSIRTGFLKVAGPRVMWPFWLWF